MFIVYLMIGIIIWFAIKIYLAVKSARRKAGEIFGQFGRQASPRQGERKAGWSGAPQPRRKKIDPAVGEYVAFEEITDVTAHASTSKGDTAADIEVEQQITDVEWEDIK